MKDLISCIGVCLSSVIGIEVGGTSEFSGLSWLDAPLNHRYDIA